MAEPRKDRLKKVLALQEKLKRLHETRQAMHLSQAVSAEQEANEIRERIGAGGSLSEVFPEIYHRRIARANQRQRDSLAMARDEAGHLATANARADIVERSYREAVQMDERKRGEKDQLEDVERRSSTRK